AILGIGFLRRPTVSRRPITPTRTGSWPRRRCSIFCAAEPQAWQTANKRGQDGGARPQAFWPQGPEPFGPVDKGASERMKAMPEPKQPAVKRNIAVSKKAVDEAFKALSNWGRWGKDDQIGTLNHVTPADIVAAAKLIKRGKAFALGIPLGQSGPQRGLFGKRWNPIHTMLATGTDALAGRQGGLLYADDALNMPIQSATHWDSLGHIFYHDKMYNGHHASAVDSNGLSKLGIEHAKDKLVGRGVLLDIARFKGLATLADGEGISNDDLDASAEAQKVAIRKGDFVIVRTGQMEACNSRGEWGG